MFHGQDSRRIIFLLVLEQEIPPEEFAHDYAGL